MGVLDATQNTMTARKKSGLKNLKPGKDVEESAQMVPDGLTVARARFMDRQDLRPWMKEFLDVLAQTGLVGVAARAANVSPQSVWEFRKKWPAFDEACKEAAEASVDIVEQAARSRAVDGVRRLKFDPKTGKPYIDPATGKAYEEVEYSDELAKFILRGRRPEIYGDKSKVEVSGGIVHAVIGVEDLANLQARREAALKKADAAEVNGSQN